MACRHRSLLLASLALVLRRCRRRQDLTFAFVFLSWYQFINNLKCFKFFFNFELFTLSNFQFCLFPFFLSIFVSEMVCLAFLQFLPCFFFREFSRSFASYWSSSLYASLLLSSLFWSSLFCSSSHWSSSKVSSPLFLLRRDSTLSYVPLQMGTTNWDNLALPELSELC